MNLRGIVRLLLRKQAFCATKKLGPFLPRWRRTSCTGNQYHTVSPITGHHLLTQAGHVTYKCMKPYVV